MHRGRGGHDSLCVGKELLACRLRVGEGLRGGRLCRGGVESLIDHVSVMREGVANCVWATG